MILFQYIVVPQQSQGFLGLQRLRRVLGKLLLYAASASSTSAVCMSISSVIGATVVGSYPHYQAYFTQPDSGDTYNLRETRRREYRKQVQTEGVGAIYGARSSAPCWAHSSADFWVWPSALRRAAGYADSEGIGTRPMTPTPQIPLIIVRYSRPN